MTSNLEWLGGRFEMLVNERGEERRAHAHLWLELPTRLIVGSEIVVEPETRSLGESLKIAIKKPLAGSSRTPDRIRVATEEDAESIRAELGDRAGISVGPVPELEAIFEEISELTDPRAEPSFFAAPAVTPELVGELFVAAGPFFQAAPWQLMAEEQLLRVDAPAFEIENAVACVIGGAGKDFGFLVFPTMRDYRNSPQWRKDGAREHGRCCH